MLAEKEENAEIREFWDFSKGVTYTMNFPELVGKYCVGVGFPGWLFSADEQGHMNLFHLFSRTLINLPDMDMLQGSLSRRNLVVIEGDDSYGVKQFRVYKINDSSYEEVKYLGNRALFLGFSATLAVEPPPGCQGNRIYFTDDCREAYFCMERGGGKDMGVYNLLDGTIVPHFTGQSYHKLTPPLWV
ncbi:hypothetical protein RND71_023705 [Anisodus tanguticus]|uniref:KIB1-4 beta-propeller domain-containing protein n=1 Tax=Anisodus tanguticus TaxID=243964 RepID=A0AAE1RUW1_9SOLA|nr:hypothetical protein RND71_023705 [Anisodus tanguticus]